jgi:KH domain
MDVLNPELMWIGTRCYRVNIPNTERKQEEISRVNYDNEDNFECEYSYDDFFEIETIDNGNKFQLKVHIPQMFHSQIIGSKGATKRRLEQGEECFINSRSSKKKTFAFRNFVPAYSTENQFKRHERDN